MSGNLSYKMRKTQIIGLMVLGVFILLVQLGFYFYKTNNTEQSPEIELLGDSALPKAGGTELSPFNPNDLDEEGWQRLGFSEKQVKTILKYKDIVGGRFVSKEQLSKCYVISKEKYETLKNFIILPETYSENRKPQYSHSRHSLYIKGKFNPDQYTQAQWQALGFSERQAQAIMKYKNYLGGSFLSKEKFAECFVISPENYRQLAPYLILPEKVEKDWSNADFDKTKRQKINLVSYTKFNPNSYSKEDWERIGFSEKQAQAIINYRDKKLGGRFSSLGDLKNCFVISEQKYQEMAPYIVIPKEAEKPKIDFSKLELNSITYEQLLAFGFSPKEAKGFVSFREALGGFQDKNQILEVYGIDQNLASKLMGIAQFDNSKVKKYKLVEAPENWLKQHPYFKYYSDKILYFRMNYRSTDKILKKANARDFDLPKMKLYLRE